MPQDLCAAERVIFEHRICLCEMILSLVRDVTNNGGKSDGNAGREWAFTRDTAREAAASSLSRGQYSVALPRMVSSVCLDYGPMGEALPPHAPANVVGFDLLDDFAVVNGKPRLPANWPMRRRYKLTSTGLSASAMRPRIRTKSGGSS